MKKLNAYVSTFGALMFILSMAFRSQSEAASDVVQASRPAQASGNSLVQAATERALGAYRKQHPEFTMQWQPALVADAVQALKRGEIDLCGVVGARWATVTPERESRELVFVPIGAESIAVCYNLPDVDNLVLDGPILGDILLGRITSWADERIRKVNPNAKLPKTLIRVVHARGSMEKDWVVDTYLTKADSEWARRAETQPAAAWPAARDVPFFDQQLRELKSTPGSFGFVNRGAAIRNGVPFAKLVNHAGKIVEPTLAAATAAMDRCDFINMKPGDTIDADGDGSYPLTFPIGFVMRSRAPSGDVNDESAKQLTAWLTGDGQEYLADFVAPLSKKSRREAAEVLKTHR